MTGMRGGAGGGSFGGDIEETGRPTYGTYLQLSQLLSLQHAQTDAHDELLFIVAYQADELWLKQLLHELEAARDAMFDGRLWWSRHTLTRARAIERVFLQHLEVLLTMMPQDFREFRADLASTSGFHSVQYREMEFLSGAKDPAVVDGFVQLTEPERHRLRRRLTEPSLWDAFLSVLERVGLPAGPDEVAESMTRVARDRSTYGEVWDVAEGLLGHDESQAVWRSRHLLMVERHIGSRVGAADGAGTDYLRTRLGLRYYPALWEMRNRL